MEKDPKILIKSGTEAIASKDWHLARNFFEEARSIILQSLQQEEKKNEEFRGLLLVLEGNGTPGRPGRMAMAQDYRDRIAGLRAWMIMERVQKGMNAAERRLAFQKARYELAFNSLMPALQDAAKEAIQEITQGENYNENEYFKITEHVFAHITLVLETLDPNNEEEIIQFCMEIPTDSSFEAERRISRSNNQLAVEARIFAHYHKVKSSSGPIKETEKITSAMDKLTSEIISALDIRRS